MPKETGVGVSTATDGTEQTVVARDTGTSDETGAYNVTGASDGFEGKDETGVSGDNDADLEETGGDIETGVSDGNRAFGAVEAKDDSGQTGLLNRAAASLETGAAETGAVEVVPQSFSGARKIGTGKRAWWQIGEYTSSVATSGRTILIGVKTHRGQSRVGLLFYDKRTNAKLGRILLQNDIPRHEDLEGADTSAASATSFACSTFKGMEIATEERGEGWTKVFIAIWLRVCLVTGTYPRVGIMRKPLLSYVMAEFDFLPQAGGTPAELLRPSDEEKLDAERTPKLTLFSPLGISLKGLLSNRDCRRQNITVLDAAPTGYSTGGHHGTTIYLVTSFEHRWAILDGVVVHHSPKRELEQIDGDSEKWRFSAPISEERVDGAVEQWPKFLPCEE